MLNLTEFLRFSDSVTTKTDISTVITWEMGVFSIIAAIITVMGLLLTLRFLYVEKAFNGKISELNNYRESFIVEREENFDKFKADNLRQFGETISIIDILTSSLEKHHRRNKKLGVPLDILGMSFLIVVGLFATTGYFEDKMILLIFMVAVVSISPILHFWLMIRKISIPTRTFFS